jgi:hypothetical protein
LALLTVLSSVVHGQSKHPLTAPDSVILSGYSTINARAETITTSAAYRERSRPVMDQLHGWLGAQLAERRTEPNSGLGQAISYLLRHWQPLTLFLRKAGAPLDNNIVEGSLKRAALHRKNSLFCRTLNACR